MSKFQAHASARLPRLAFLLILWLAFAARLFALDAVRHEFDWAAPHAAGIGILESLARGDVAALPLVGAGASIAVPNPALSSYFWAVISLFSRSPLVATAISAMLGVLSVALTLDLARQLMGQSAAIWAGLLAATSPWSIYFARGTWLQGQTEFCAALVAWLVIIALQRRQSKRLFVGLLTAAIVSQTYLVAFGLIVQSGLAMMIGLRRNLIRATVAGMGVCLIAVISFLWLVGGEAQVPKPNTVNRATAAQVHINQEGIFHTLRLVSGRDHEAAGEDREVATRAPAKVWTDGRALFIEGMLMVGLILLAAGQVRLRGGMRMNWIVIAWLVLPPLVSIGVTLVLPSWLIHPAYMLLTAPAGYLAAAVPIAWLEARLRTVKTLALVMLIGVPVVFIALNRQAALVQDSYRHPLAGQLAWLPLDAQMQLHDVWQAQCDEVATDEDVRWTASVFQSTLHALPPDKFVQERSTTSGHMWWMPLHSRRCLTQIARTQIPLSASFPITLTDGTLITTTQLVPFTPPAGLAPLSTNVGWLLLGLKAPRRAIAGTTIKVEHIWQISTLPNEDYADWYYAPFVKLIAPDGQEIVQVDSAPSVPGSEWRAGDTLISQIELRIPRDAPPGNYILEMSLFDPNQKKNAAYFGSDNPAQPIVSLRRRIQITRAN